MKQQISQVIGSLYLPASWPASESFQEISFPLRFLLLPIWVKIVLSKYIFAWLLAESVCTFSGLSFVEQRQDGSVDWRGCAHVKVHREWTLLMHSFEGVRRRKKTCLFLAFNFV